MEYPTLASWDEAWYASIAREMVKTGEFMHMSWNGLPFYDHPPMGMWLMALSFKIFGISEFSARLPSVIAGILSMILIYKLGLELFKSKLVGFVAGLVLGTSVWYVIRVRSGNLDSLFVLFYLATVYFSVLSSKKFRWFPVAGLSFGALIMTKTLVGLSALPLILFINFFQFFKRENIPHLLGGIALCSLVVLPWYIIHFQTYPDFYHHHFVKIGTRDKTWMSYFQLSYQEPFFYIHMGVRKWYYLWLAAISYLVMSLKFFKKETAILFLWNIVVLYPFLTSEKTELWHLIPVYLPLSLTIAYGFYDLGLFLFRLFERIDITRGKYKHIMNVKIVYLGIFACFVYLAFVQFKIFRHEVFPTTMFTSDDVDISRSVAKYDTKTIFLDDDYLPIAVFYSGKPMRQMGFELEDKKTLVNLFRSDAEDFIVITRNWAVTDLDKAGIRYKFLEKNNSFTILGEEE